MRASSVVIAFFLSGLAPALWIGAFLFFDLAEFGHAMHALGQGSSPEEWANADAVFLRARVIVACIAVGGFIAAFFALRQWFGIFYVPSDAVGSRLPDPATYQIQPTECQHCNMVIAHLNAQKRCPYCNCSPGNSVNYRGGDGAEKR